MTKPILSELKFFVNGVSNIYRGLPPDVSAQLVKCSLNLLEDLPSSREAVLEYFSMVFDSSVGNYIVFIEVNTIFLYEYNQPFFYLHHIIEFYRKNQTEHHLKMIQ